MTTISIGDVVAVTGLKLHGEGIVADVYQTAKNAAFGEHKPRRGLYPQIMIVPINDTNKKGGMRHLYYDANDLKEGKVTLVTPATALDAAMSNLARAVLKDAAGGDDVTEAEVVEHRRQFIVQVTTPAPDTAVITKALSAKVSEISGQVANTYAKRPLFMALSDIGNQLFGLLENGESAEPLDAQISISQAITNCTAAQLTLVSVIVSKAEDAADAKAQAELAASQPVIPAPEVSAPATA